MDQKEVTMAASKRAKAETISISRAVDPGVGTLNVTVFDGTRSPIKQGTKVLLTVRDGFQNQLYREYVSGPQIPLHLPVRNNLGDNYAIIVFTPGSQQAGFQPVHVTPDVPQTLDLMLLPTDSGFHFAQARWKDVQAKRPVLAKIFSAGLSGEPGDAYGSLIEEHPDRLACLLNITTAMQQILLAQGTPLDYFKALDIDSLAPDRFFGYADAKLVSQVRMAAQRGVFETQPASDLVLHTDATSSFKQVQFGEANVQLTFHENNRKSIGGVDCVYVEPDVDYYKDPGAHAILEVLPNAFSSGKTDPRVVYVLRWIAGRHAGVREFDPLYTIE
jgi:hypothetical protein